MSLDGSLLIDLIHNKIYGYQFNGFNIQPVLFEKTFAEFSNVRGNPNYIDHCMYFTAGDSSNGYIPKINYGYCTMTSSNCTFTDSGVGALSLDGQKAIFCHYNNSLFYYYQLDYAILIDLIGKKIYGYQRNTPNIQPVLVEKTFAEFCLAVGRNPIYIDNCMYFTAGDSSNGYIPKINYGYCTIST